MATLAELVSSEQLARRELAEIESLYESAPVGLCLLDRDLRYVRINRRLADFNGVEPEAHIGRHIREIVPQVSDIAEPILRRALESGEPTLQVELSGETHAHPGEIHHWIEQYVPLRDKRGEVFGINVLVQDVTEEKRAEAERERLYERARLAADEWERVVSWVSHDLRSPLDVILTTTRILTGGRGPGGEAQEVPREHREGGGADAPSGRRPRRSVAHRRRRLRCGQVDPRSRRPRP